MAVWTFHLEFIGDGVDAVAAAYNVTGLKKSTSPKVYPWSGTPSIGDMVELQDTYVFDPPKSDSYVGLAFKLKPGYIIKNITAYGTASKTSKIWYCTSNGFVGNATYWYGGGRVNMYVGGELYNAVMAMSSYSASYSQEMWYDVETELYIPKVSVSVEGNATLDPNVTWFNASMDWSSRLVPNDGYTISSVNATLTYSDEWGNEMDQPYNSIIDESFNINVPSGTLMDGMSLKFSVVTSEKPVEPDPPPRTVFKPSWWPDPGDYTTSATEVDTTDGPGEINIYPKSGYKVTNVYIEVLDAWGNHTGSYITQWVRNNGNGSFSLVIPQGEGGTIFEVSVSTEALPAEDRTISQTLLHCSSNITVTTVPHGSSVPFVNGDKLIVTADAGYHFESSDDLTVVVAGVEYHAEETPTENVMTLSCGLVDWTSVVDDIIITATAHNDLPVSDPDGLSLGFVNIYNPTADEMKEAGSKQYISGSGTLSDMSQFVLKAFKIYAKPKVTDDKHEIMWGVYHSTVNSYLVTEAYVDLECGSVVIPEIYGNCLDYQPAVEVQLYLPFIGVVNVTASDFVDKNATLTYRVDVLTGNCLASLSSNGIVVNVWTGNMAEDIPLTVSRINTVNTQLGVEAVQMMNRTPYFIVKRKKPLIPDGSSRLDLDAEFWSVLGNLKGYTECLYVSVEGMTATSVEKAEIERLLKAGVII